MFSSLSKKDKYKYKVAGHVNGVHCTCYSCTMEFHVEKKLSSYKTVQDSAIDMLPTVQMSSEFNMKNSYQLGFIYKFI